MQSVLPVCAKKWGDRLLIFGAFAREDGIDKKRKIL